MLGFQSSHVSLTLTSNSVSMKVKFCCVYCKLKGCSAIRGMIIQFSCLMVSPACLSEEAL